MQYSVVHLSYTFAEEWQQDLFEQAMCDIGFEVFDDANAYEYLNGNRADSVTGLKNMIENKIGKEIEILIHKNESGYSAEETVPDLRQLIQFDIVEENFDEE